METPNVKVPKPERQIIFELCQIIDMFHNYGNEADSVHAMTEERKRRYYWALQEAEDS